MEVAFEDVAQKINSQIFNMFINMDLILSKY